MPASDSSQGHEPRRARIRRRRAGLGLIAAAALAAGVLVAANGNQQNPEPAQAAQATAKASTSQRAERIAVRLSPRQLAGQRLVAGLNGTTITPQLRGMVRRGETAGVILFADNFPTRAAGRRLVTQLQAIQRPAGLRRPLLIMIDQEGGLVKRIDGAPNSSAAAIGRRGAAYSRRQGVKTGRNLRNVGVNVNLAPVVDVARPGGDIDDTDRAFGSDPRQVIQTAIPFAQGLQSTGVAATAKHFPGLGAIQVNTDFAAQTVNTSRAGLRRIDLPPYRRFIGSGGKLIMLGTAIYPAYSSKPAAFTRRIATGELRNRLGFEGVSITDAMGTVAVSEFSGAAAAAVSAARAGVDLLLYTEQPAAAQANRVLVRKLRQGRLPEAEFVKSAARVLSLREGL